MIKRLFYTLSLSFIFIAFILAIYLNQPFNSNKMYSLFSQGNQLGYLKKTIYIDNPLQTSNQIIKEINGINNKGLNQSDKTEDNVKILNNMHVSKNLIEFIINYEGNAGMNPPLRGLEGDVYGLYNDPEENCTVGIGHLVHFGKCNTKDITKHKEKFPNGITKDIALKSLKKDLIFIENDIKDNVGVSLSQNQFDALVDFDFNEGVETLKSSQLLKDVNEGNFDIHKIKNDFLQFTRDGLLIDRRNDEANMFNYNIYAGI